MKSLGGLVACCLLVVHAGAGCVESDGVGLGGGAPGEGGSEPLAGSGGEAQGGGDNQGGSQVPAEEDPFEPPPTPSGFSDEELGTLASAIDDALASASATYSARVIGLDSGQVVYEKNAASLKVPASNTKLFTTAAALVLGGEAGRPSAGVYGAVDGGVVSGDLVLFGEHDPLTAAPFGASARQSLDAAAALLSERGVTAVSGAAVAQGEFLYEGDSLGTIDFAVERSQTASAFRAALIAAGISVAGGATTSSSLAPPSQDLVFAMPSASFDVIAHAINVPSHNEMADLLMHHLGIADGGPSTFASGATTVAEALDDLGVAHDGFALNDGSGLSHDNRVSAIQVTSLLQAMAQRADWSAYVHSMAIAGVRGTIASRMTGADTNGRFWGKTGTLTGVVALSGVLFHRHDGQRYAVSLLANDVANATSARAALDAAVGALSANRKGKTGLLPAPALVRVQDDGNGQTALVELAPVAGASAYLLWRSADGRTWRREDARLIAGPKHRTFTFDGSLFVRVTAVGDAGEGAPSSVLAVRTGSGDKTLFVDGNQRYAAAPVAENPMAWGNDAVVLHAHAMQGSFESCSAQQVADGAVDLADFDRVIWASGRESTADETFSASEQTRVRAFVEAGGRLFVSGAELGYDLIEQGSPADIAFANEVLGIDYVADDAGTTFVTKGDLDLDLDLARFSKLGLHEATFPDVIANAGTGQSCLRYAAGLAGDACVLTETDAGGRVIVLGFPLESLDDPTLGAQLVGLLQ